MSKYTIPAVPCEYRGEWFDSLLERHWAITFDALDVPWSTARLVVKSDRRRLTSANALGNPDFFLPRWMLFVDIKPTADHVLAEVARWEEIARQSRIPLVAIGGRRHDCLGVVYFPNGQTGTVHWTRCPGCRAVALAAIDIEWWAQTDVIEWLKSEDLDLSISNLKPPSIWWWSECDCLRQHVEWESEDIGWLTASEPWSLS